MYPFLSLCIITHFHRCTYSSQAGLRNKKKNNKKNSSSRVVSIELKKSYPSTEFYHHSWYFNFIAL